MPITAVTTAPVTPMIATVVAGVVALAAAAIAAAALTAVATTPVTVVAAATPPPAVNVGLVALQRDEAVVYRWQPCARPCQAAVPVVNVAAELELVRRPAAVAVITLVLPPVAAAAVAQHLPRIRRRVASTTTISSRGRVRGGGSCTRQERLKGSQLGKRVALPVACRHLLPPCPVTTRRRRGSSGTGRCGCWGRSSGGGGGGGR